MCEPWWWLSGVSLSSFSCQLTPDSRGADLSALVYTALSKCATPMLPSIPSSYSADITVKYPGIPRDNQLPNSSESPSAAFSCRTIYPTPTAFPTNNKSSDERRCKATTNNPVPRPSPHSRWTAPQAHLHAPRIVRACATGRTLQTRPAVERNQQIAIRSRRKREQREEMG